jgi:hypothetical protein
MTAFMRCFGPMVQTESPPARFTSEGEKIELAAVFVLAVSPNGFEVVVCHLREGGWVL